MLSDNQLTKLILIGLIIILNTVSYFLYYSDKKRAVNNKKRISEKNLLLSTFFFGGFGAWIGMKQFNHKTKHTKFKILVPLAALITFRAIYFVLTTTY